MVSKAKEPAIYLGLLLTAFVIKLLRSRLRQGRQTQIALIQGPESPSFLTGHVRELYHRTRGLVLHDHLTRDYNGVARVKGYFGDNQLYVTDLVALHSIIIKEQNIFEETDVFIENNKIIFGEGLVATRGDLHKKQRRLVTPAFSLHRLKRLVPVFLTVALRLKTALLSEMHASNTHSQAQQRPHTREDGDGAGKLGSELDPRAKTKPESEPEPRVWVTDMSEWVIRAALESIGVVGLGYSLDPLDSPALNPYTKAVRALIPTMFCIAPLRLLTPFITRLGPPTLRRRLLDLVPIRAVQQLKEMSDQMDSTCRDVLARKRERQRQQVVDLGVLEGSMCEAGACGFTETEARDYSVKSSDSEHASRVPGETESMVLADERDIMSILLKANEDAGEQEKLSEQELIGQMNVLIFGAQDTTSSALSRTLYLLSRPEHQSLQEKLRSEFEPLHEALQDQTLRYEDFESLPLLDAVLKETLRLFPPVPFVRRSTTQATILPLGHSIKLLDNTYVDRISVPANTTVWVSISGANRSPDIWGPDAEEWRPDRWLVHENEHTQLEGKDAGAQHNHLHLRSKDCASNGKLRLPSIYGGMLTFFAGGRSCVGYRFALIEMKIILLMLISTFRFSATDDHISWNLSQIVSPSFSPKHAQNEDAQGMPIAVEAV